MRNWGQYFRGRRASYSPPLRWLVYGWLGGAISVLLVACLWADRGLLPAAPTAHTPDARDTTAPVASDDEPSHAAVNTDTGIASSKEAKVSTRIPAPKVGQPDTKSNMPTVLPGLKLAGAFDFMPLPQLASKSVSASSGAGSDKTVNQWCKAVAGRLLGVQRDDCIDNGFVDSGYRSVEGRPIVVRQVRPERSPSMGRVLLIGGIHGDELTSVGLTFAWLDALQKRGSSYAWHVAPVMNPDGLLADNPQRINANGVDLNRNMPTTAWRQESERYWRKVGFEPRRYPGDAPASEPETQWLVDEIAAFRPDVIISVHAPYGVLDYDGKFPAPQQLGSLDLHPLGVYPGSLGNFASRMHGIPVITVELDHAWELPSDTEIARMWSDLNDWLNRYFSSVRQVQSEKPVSDTG